MANTVSNKLLTIWKIFCGMFGKMIVSMMILKLIYSIFNIRFPFDGKGILRFATLFSLLSIRDYVEYSKEIMYNDLSKEDVINRVLGFRGSLYSH